MTDPHELASVLADLARAGVELAAHGDRLRHRPATLAPDLSARIREHKADELGQLTHVGSPAWSIAVAESMAASRPRAPPATPDGWHVGNTPIKPGPFDHGPEVPTWVLSLFAATP